MANKKRPTPKRSDDQAKYYDLKVEAVNDLVDALKSDPHVPLTEEQKKNQNTPNPYKNDFLRKIPTWVKMFFIKFWIGGAFCFFVYMGLPILIGNLENTFLLSGLILGVITDWMINSALLYFETDRLEYHPYMMLPVSCKKIWTILINIPYGLLEVFTIYFIYRFLQIYAFENLTVEPLLFGVLYLLVDMFYISIKNIIVYLVKKMKRNNNSEA